MFDVEAVGEDAGDPVDTDRGDLEARRHRDRTHPGALPGEDLPCLRFEPVTSGPVSRSPQVARIIDAERTVGGLPLRNRHLLREGAEEGWSIRWSQRRELALTIDGGDRQVVTRDP